VRILGADRKRLHAAFDFHTAHYADPVATGEMMLLHVHQGETATGSAPFPAEISTAIEAMRVATAASAAPPQGSRRIELRSPREWLIRAPGLPEAAIRRLLRPQTMALIGGGWTDAVAAGNAAIGYRGQIWRVHPHAGVHGELPVLPLC
jgi:hypothetical protein